MGSKRHWLMGFTQTIRGFFAEVILKSPYELVEVYECQRTNFTKIIVKLPDRSIMEQNLSDVVTDSRFLESFDKKAIQTLTYLATIEGMKPEYSVVVQKQDGGEVDDYILEIKSRSKPQTIIKTPTELFRDKSLLVKFGPLDANRIGYLAGIKETVSEFKLKAMVSSNSLS